MVPEIYRAAEDRFNDKMSYRRCGKSGVLLPELSLGFWHNFGSVNTFENSIKMVHHAFDNGINYFDLANNYGPVFGSAEETFGQIMAKSLKPYRDEMFISSKAGHDMWRGPYGHLGSRKHLMASLDQSLKRMNIDYVDIFYSHVYDPNTPLEETLQALVDMVKCGKALYVGISKYPPKEAEFAYNYLRDRDVPCLCYQGKYNMFFRDPEAEILPQAQQQGAGYVAFSPLAQGLLTNKYIKDIPADSRIGRGAELLHSQLTSEVHKKIELLNNVALERGQSLAQMALSWVLRDNRVTSVIIGTSSVAQIDDNLKALSAPAFSESEIALIDSILL